MSTSWEPDICDTGDLTERVDTGVGATGALDGDWLTFERCERPLEQRLNRIARGLTLPADEPAAVVARCVSLSVRTESRGLPHAHARQAREPGFTTG